MRSRGPGFGVGHRLAVVVILAVGVALVVTIRSRAPAQTPAAPGLGPARVSARDGDYTLIQLPGDGSGSIYQLVVQARRSVAVEVYELTDPVILVELVRAHGRGVDIHVLLSRAYHSGRVNAAAFSYLRAHAVPVRWAPASTIFHIKAVVVDASVAVISTGNFVSARQGALTRDAVIVDRDMAQVSAIGATMTADWTARARPAPARSAPGLVWSPQAKPAVLGEIAAARDRVLFTSEELADSDVVGALAGDARRGVACYVVMTNDRAWRAAWRMLVVAGCHVHVAADRADQLYLHIKRLLVDPGRSGGSLLLGSQNASTTSLIRNRELSVRLAQDRAPNILAAATATFWRDYNGAPAWSA